MVKRQRDKQYQSAREYRSSSQARSGAGAVGSVQRRLPFSHCALSLTPFETPVCNRDGIVFENSVLLPFLMKHKIDPVSGKPMSSRDVITLHMEKDEEGRWNCPVLTKPLADHTKIVAILQPNGTEANVYSYEAYHELNVKAKNYEDLISGVKFNKKKDVLLLNDPNNEELNQRRDINRFYHIIHARELEQENSSSASDVRYSVTATRIMETLKQNKSKEASASSSKARQQESSAPRWDNHSEWTTLEVDGMREIILAADVTGVKLTSGIVASSLTSTAEAVAHDNLERQATLEEVLQSQSRVMRKLKQKGLVRLRTNLGDLTLELHAEMVPRTCINFLGLCRAGKYDGTVFHRLIKSFMIQGGKAMDGEEDESIWGGAFSDEFDDRLHHAGGGIVSMANAGAHTNKQQFFITFKSCGHLDRKHSIFGKVVQGMDVLKAMENIATDKKDRPKEEIKIVGTDVLKDPAQEARQIEEERIRELVRERRGGRQVKRASRSSVAAGPDAAGRQDVGRYLKEKLKATTGSAMASDEASTEFGGKNPSRLPPPPKKTKFGDFGGW